MHSWNLNWAKKVTEILSWSMFFFTALAVLYLFFNKNIFSEKREFCYSSNLPNSNSFIEHIYLYFLQHDFLCSVFKLNLFNEWFALFSHVFAKTGTRISISHHANTTYAGWASGMVKSGNHVVLSLHSKCPSLLFIAFSLRQMKWETGLNIKEETDPHRMSALGEGGWAWLEVKGVSCVPFPNHWNRTNESVIAFNQSHTYTHTVSKDPENNVNVRVKCLQGLQKCDHCMWSIFISHRFKPFRFITLICFIYFI